MVGDFQGIAKIPELKRRLLVTFLLIGVYRIGAHVPVPGVDAAALSNLFSQAQGGILGFADMFAGGALRRMSVFALGIMPYISASIILQLLTVVVPTLEKLSKEGEQGRKKIIQYTRYGTVVLSLIQGFGIAVGLEHMASPAGGSVVLTPGWGFRLLTVITLTAGTAFIMWLGEQITERGIGNGISLIIFAGIVAGLLPAIINTFRLMQAGQLNLFVVLLLLLVMIGVIFAIVWIERAQRRIPVQYAKRVVGRKVYGGQSTHLPLKVNTAGVIPPIFASSLLMFPTTIGQFIAHPWVQKVTGWLAPGRVLHDVLYVALIFFFAYFYTAVTFNPVDVADNMKKYGGYIPGIRPGQRTAEYIDKVLSRLVFWGALYVSIVCVLPTILINQFNVPFYFGGTGLLIIVGVAIDTVAQIETHLITRHYEGLVGSRRIRGRR
ncbi:MAG: preprotein translocase subunit SecY [Deltaproteobacteria bacterium]|nr:preprotein translocase subunit SecY [Deltaproteobacteria bacterium]